VANNAWSARRAEVDVAKANEVLFSQVFPRVNFTGSGIRNSIESRSIGARNKRTILAQNDWNYRIVLSQRSTPDAARSGASARRASASKRQQSVFGTEDLAAARGSNYLAVSRR